MSNLPLIVSRLRVAEVVVADIEQRRPKLTKRLMSLQVNFSELSFIDRKAEICEREIARIRAELDTRSAEVRRVLETDSAILLERVCEALSDFESLVERAAGGSHQANPPAYAFQA